MIDTDTYIELKHRRGRKPIDLVASMPVPQGRDKVWAAIRKLRTFTMLELEAETHISTVTMSSYLQGLTAAKYLSVSARMRPGRRGVAKTRTWTLERDVGIEAPRVTRKGDPVSQGNAREVMWRTMRILSDFDARDLIAAGSSERVALELLHVQDYIKLLHKAGYLVLTQASKRRWGSARFRLVRSRYSGPRPPQIQRVKQVFDPNLNRVVWPGAKECGQ